MLLKTKLRSRTSSTSQPDFGILGKLEYMDSEHFWRQRLAWRTNRKRLGLMALSPALAPPSLSFRLRIPHGAKSSPTTPPRHQPRFFRSQLRHRLFSSAPSCNLIEDSLSTNPVVTLIISGTAFGYAL